MILQMNSSSLPNLTTQNLLKQIRKQLCNEEEDLECTILNTF